MSAEQILSLSTRLEAAIVVHRQGLPESHPAYLDDGAYDALESQLRLLDPNHPLLNTIDDSDFNVVEALTIAMGSQNKALTLDDMAPFHNKTQEPVYFWSGKVDGMSSEVTYHYGELARVLTRGDGKLGANITVIAKDIPSLPKRISLKDPVVIVRGEICMRKDQLEPLNVELVAAGREPFSNTRNGTVGVVKTMKNAHLAKYLDFQAFDVLVPEAC